MAWQDNTARVEVDVPLSVAWELWSDREGVNRWMPWIASVKILKDQPELSEWTLKYNAFGRDLEFSWLARNLQPIQNQKIHWRSLDGLPNRGAVRFYPRGPASCGVELTISYEVPEILSGVASGLSPLVENILQRDLERFASFAKKNINPNLHLNKCGAISAVLFKNKDSCFKSLICVDGPHLNDFVIVNCCLYLQLYNKITNIKQD